jgi:hypothetical protein
MGGDFGERIHQKTTQARFLMTMIYLKLIAENHRIFWNVFIIPFELRNEDHLDERSKNQPEIEKKLEYGDLDPRGR